MDTLRLTLLVIACLFGLQLLLKGVLYFVLPPVLIRTKQTLARDPDLYEVVADDMTPEMREFLGQTIRQFTDLGFQTRVTVRANPLPAESETYQSVLVHPLTRDVVLIALVRVKSTRTMHFWITSEFSDDTAIVTSTSQNCEVLPCDPRISRASFSWATSAAQALEAHHRRLLKSGRARERRVAPEPGAELAKIRQSWSEEIGMLERIGYLKLEPSDRYRYTWRGACMVGWKSAPPILRRRTELRDRRARRLWKQLEMDRWTPPPRSDTEPEVPSAVENVPSRPAEITSELDYSSGLVEGEVRRHQGNGSLIIRMGGPTAGRVLARNWQTFGILAFLFAVLGMQVIFFHRLSVRRILSLLQRRHDLAVQLGLSMGALVLLLIWEFWRLMRKVSRARGTMILTADHRGLEFSNSPGRIASGFIPRHEIVRFLIRPVIIAFVRRSYRLEVRYRQWRLQQLLIGPNKADLLAIEADLRVAMGIDNAPARSQAPWPANG